MVKMFVYYAKEKLSQHKDTIKNRKKKRTRTTEE